MEINVKANPKKKRKLNVKTFFLYLIISLLTVIASTLASFIFYGGKNTYPFVNPTFVQPYETFKISLGTNFTAQQENEIKNKLGVLEKAGVKRFEFDNSSNLKIGWSKDGYILSKYIVPVAHFYTITDDFNSKAQKIVVDSSIPGDIQTILINEYPNSKVVNNIKENLDKNGKTIALIQAKDLSYEYKLLKVNGKYFLDDKEGAMTFSLKLNEENPFIEQILKKNLSSLDIFEYNYENIGKLNQTGVTAITRALASRIEQTKDYGWPARKISAFLKDADLTHVSNEISNVPGCVPADGMRFCSKTEYMKTLKDIGVDIVELTGNHNNDFGADWNLATIKYYDSIGWKYFGGGKNATDAAKILYVESKGTKIAFLGYDYYDTMQGTGALATATKAGANSYSDSKMKKNIAEANKNADIVIVDFQFQECYSYPAHKGAYPPCYKALTVPDQKGTFRKAVEYGADIVVGTQAHQPQTYEIYNGKMIFYGLGNLFFDQAYWLGTKQGLILTHYYLDGKYIQTKLTTTLYDINLQPYITTGKDRVELLNYLKEAR